MALPFDERWEQAGGSEQRPWTPTRAAYVAYMNSDGWRRRRAEKITLHLMEHGVLVCDICGELIDVHQGQVAVVHHLTYARFGNERPRDLEVVHDGKCHDEADKRRVIRERFQLKLVQETSRVHPDQLQLFDDYEPMGIENVVADSPPPDGD